MIGQYTYWPHSRRQVGDWLSCLLWYTVYGEEKNDIHNIILATIIVNVQYINNVTEVALE